MNANNTKKIGVWKIKQWPDLFWSFSEFRLDFNSLKRMQIEPAYWGIGGKEYIVWIFQNCSITWNIFICLFFWKLNRLVLCNHCHPNFPKTWFSTINHKSLTIKLHYTTYLFHLRRQSCLNYLFEHLSTCCQESTQGFDLNQCFIFIYLNLY